MTEKIILSDYRQNAFLHSQGHRLPLRPRWHHDRCTQDSRRVAPPPKPAESGPVSRASPVHTVMRNYTGDEGRSFEFDNQVLISSHPKLLWSKALVVNVAEKSGHDPVRHGRERRA